MRRAETARPRARPPAGDGGLDGALATGRDDRVRQRASALIVVIWCVAILTVVTTGMLYTSRLELRVGKNHGDLTQAYYLALAGIETAKAEIYRESKARKNAAWSFRSTLDSNPAAFRDVRLGRGLFRVMRPARPEEVAGETVYGLRDEESRLNVNTAALEEIQRLPGMTNAVAAAIADWRDGDGKLTPEGAEQDYYASLAEPYVMRNGPFETLRELLQVRGVTEDRLLGEDANFNGRLDPEENDGEASYPLDDRDGVLNPGWSRWLTVHSEALDVDARGKTRVNITFADADALAEVDAISPELAAAIVAYREKQKLETVGHLLDVRVVNQPGSSAGDVVFSSGDVSNIEVNNTGVIPVINPVIGVLEDASRTYSQAVPGRETRSGGEEKATAERGGDGGDTSLGEKLIDRQLFQEIVDHVTTRSGRSIPGAVNINGAEVATLACLPGLELDLAQAIVDHRLQYGDFENIGELLDVPGMSGETFKKVCPRVTCRSFTYRILAEGVLQGTGARKRIEVVVRDSTYAFDTLSYREDL